MMFSFTDELHVKKNTYLIENIEKNNLTMRQIVASFHLCAGFDNRLEVVLAG